MCLVASPAAIAQDTPPVTETLPRAGALESPYDGLLVSSITFIGLERVSEGFARNQLRSEEGRPFDSALVQGDLQRLERLGQFREISAEVVPAEDGSVSIEFSVTESPIVEDVAWVGNRQINDEEIATVVRSSVTILPGVPLDEYQIGRGQREIEKMYRERGFYQVEVTIDESELSEAGVLIYRVREGERVAITDIRFDGNLSFPDKKLRPEIETRTRGLFKSGPLDEGLLRNDVSSLIAFYRDRGFLDVRASYEIQPSPNGREAIVTFVVEEGPRYTLRDVFVVKADADAEGEDTAVFSADQIKGLMTFKPGDVFGVREVEGSIDAVRDAYLQMGYVDARVAEQTLRDPEEPVVDLRVLVLEGRRFRTGLVVIQGNDLTQQKVIRRRVENQPDRWLDATKTEDAERFLRVSQLFEPSAVAVTIQPENEATPGYRDILVQVAETNTGSIGFGVSANTDFGVAGGISLSQRNFDISDTPDSFDEFVRGRAFRGAGQQFSIAAQPGTDQSVYSVSFAEPALLESEYSLRTSAFFREREFRDYDEERFGANARLGRRFGTRWSGGLSFRAESIEISDIDFDAPVDIFAVEGDSVLTSVGFDLTRSTMDNLFRPTEGTRTEISVQQVGALGGDYDYTRFFGEHTLFLKVDEDFLGRPTVLSVQTRAGYIPQDDEAPVFERFYLGGRSLRGFEFRGVGPVGVRNDTGTLGNDKIGGDFLFFFGLQVEKPVFRDQIAVVAFMDSGTIAEDVEFDQYRVSVGLGLRMYIPQFGQAPLAFDFAVPIADEETDETQVFSFSLDLPF